MQTARSNQYSQKQKRPREGEFQWLKPGLKANGCSHCSPSPAASPGPKSPSGKSGKLTIDEVSGDEKNFEKLAAKRVDAVLAIEQSGNALLATGRFPGVQMNAKYLSSAESYLAFNKSTNRQDLLSKFNDAIAQMKADGSFDRIVAEAANH